MTPQQSNPITNAVLEIMRTCIELKTVGVDAFCEYLAHVNRFVVRVYPEGWTSDVQGYRFDIYLDTDRTGSALVYLAHMQSFLTNLLPSDEKEAPPCQ